MKAERQNSCIIRNKTLDLDVIREVHEDYLDDKEEEEEHSFTKEEKEEKEKENGSSSLIGMTEEYNKQDVMKEKNNSENSMSMTVSDKETKKRNRQKVLCYIQQSTLQTSSHHNSVTFDSFYIISVRPQTLNSYFSANEFTLRNIQHSNNNNRKRWLDPFTIHSLQCLEQWPFKPNDALNRRMQNQIASLCFPTGMRIRVVPKVALDGAKALNWLGKGSDVVQCKEVSADSTILHLYLFFL